MKAVVNKGVINISIEVANGDNKVGISVAQTADDNEMFTNKKFLLDLG